MIDKIIRIFEKEYQTLNRIEISKENLIRNYKYLSSLKKGVKVAPVIKSNGSGYTNPQIGQEVLVYSDNPSDVNSLENCAKICHTITYDLLVDLGQSIKRVVI